MKTMIRPIHFKFTSLTIYQKLQALSLKYYHNMEWSPMPGNYYTSTRDDFELYKIIGVSYDCLLTQYCDIYKQSEEPARWLQRDFATRDFGLNRVWVPNFVLDPNVEDKERWFDIDNPTRDPYRYFHK